MMNDRHDKRGFWGGKIRRKKGLSGQEVFVQGGRTGKVVPCEKGKKRNIRKRRKRWKGGGESESSLFRWLEDKGKGGTGNGGRGHFILGKK